MMRSDASMGRRLIFPLIIVGVAVVIALWTTQGGSAKSAAVERFVRQLCMESAAGKSTDDLLALSEPLIADVVGRRIAGICAAQGGNVEAIRIQILAGDIHPHPGSEIATHSALIGDGHVDMLGLRIACQGNSNAVRILGYWIPETS